MTKHAVASATPDADEQDDTSALLLFGGNLHSPETPDDKTADNMVKTMALK
jgi:hypothetical protein